MVLCCFAWTDREINEPTERAEKKTRQVSANDEELICFLYLFCRVCLRVLIIMFALMKRGGFIFKRTSSDAVAQCCFLPLDSWH